MHDSPIPVGDVSLALNEVGDGPGVLFIHGFPELGYSWRHQLPALAAAGFRAIAPDMRGYGGSSKPSGIEPYGLGSLVGDVAVLLLRRTEPLPPIRLLGVGVTNLVHADAPRQLSLGL